MVFAYMMKLSGCDTCLLLTLISILFFWLAFVSEANRLKLQSLLGQCLKKKIRLKAPYVGKIVEHLKNSGDKELVTQLGRIGR